MRAKIGLAQGALQGRAKRVMTPYVLISNETGVCQNEQNRIWPKSDKTGVSRRAATGRSRMLGSASGGVCAATSVSGVLEAACSAFGERSSEGSVDYSRSRDLENIVGLSLDVGAVAHAISTEITTSTY